MKRDLVINNHIIDVPIINILEDIQRELRSKKLKDIPRSDCSDDNLMVTCPSHSDGQENNPSCGIYVGEDENIEYGTFNCFTCGIKGPFQLFVAYCFECSCETAEEWLINNYWRGELLHESLINLPEIELPSRKIKQPKIKKEIILPSNLQSWHPYMQQRKISREIAKKFEVSYDPNNQCLIFPVRDLNDNLVGLTRRSTYSKNFIIDKDFDKSNIYLLNYVNKNSRMCVVCESQINALTCFTYGIPAIALYGSGTTKEQMNVLNRSNILTFILMYDNDEAGRKGAEKFQKLIRKDKLVFDIMMPKGRDVNDLSEEEFWSLLRVNVGIEKQNCILK